MALSNSLTEINYFRSCMNSLVDPGLKEETKLKIVEKLLEDLVDILSLPECSVFFDHLMKTLPRILLESKPIFISESRSQQKRRKILKIISRLVNNDNFQSYENQILNLILHLSKIENEENTFICFRIIFEILTHQRVEFKPEITEFLKFIKTIYSKLLINHPKIFQSPEIIKIKDPHDFNTEPLLKTTYSKAIIKGEDETKNKLSLHLIPSAELSIKILQEIPQIVISMYRVYRENVQNDVVDIYSLMMKTIELQLDPNIKKIQGFNEEAFINFISAQVNILNSLLYSITFFKDVVEKYITQIVKLIVDILTICPVKTFEHQKKLLTLMQAISRVDFFKIKFLPYMEKLLDEKILLASIHSDHKDLRYLAYAAVNQLIISTKEILSLNDLSKAVNFSGKNINDQSLPVSIQQHSCQILTALIECINKKSQEEKDINRGKNLYRQILKIFTLKLKTISKLQIPYFLNKVKKSKTEIQTMNNDKFIEDTKELIESPVDDDKNTLETQIISYNLDDYRNFVKFLIIGIQKITDCWINYNINELKSLIKWAIYSFDIYRINLETYEFIPGKQDHQPENCNENSTLEENRLLCCFAGIFLKMNNQIFSEILSIKNEYIIERITINYSLQIIVSRFLENPIKSPLYAKILFEYLVKKIDCIGTMERKSFVHLRLFKILFGSVSLLAAKNGEILKKYLHKIVSKSLDYAATVEEPNNYFQILRSLFKSIAGGKHDTLYDEFLPIFPKLLERFNEFQSGLYKQDMKDRFVELCLIIPGRLSYFVPHLPLLISPILAALNSNNDLLVCQGLQTLELCIDNILSDIFNEYIQAIGSELMQALCKLLTKKNDEISHNTLRILGKLGGSNRKMMFQPQKLQYNDRQTNSPSIVTEFNNSVSVKTINIPVEKIIKTAVTALKSSSTSSFYRQHCWTIIHSYLIASLKLDDDYPTFCKFFMHSSFKEGKISYYQQDISHYKCLDIVARNVHQTALTGLFIAASNEELCQLVVKVLIPLVRHYTLITVAQQAGPFRHGSKKSSLLLTSLTQNNPGLDSFVLADALVTVMSYGDKKIYKYVEMSFDLIIETATNILGSTERACQLPFINYLAEKLYLLCYNRAWYEKFGGCISINFLLERMPTPWILNNILKFLKALMFILMNLSVEISLGTRDKAIKNIGKIMLILVHSKNEYKKAKNNELIRLNRDIMCKFTEELVRQVTSPHKFVREQAIMSLKILAELQNKSITEVMVMHKNLLDDMIPPKRCLLTYQPPNAQIGLMDGNSFCTTLNPSLFSIDINYNNFFTELLHLIQSDDLMLHKQPCYRTVDNLIPLKISAMKAFSAYHSVSNCHEKVFTVLYKVMEKSSVEELQESAFKCLKTFINNFQTLDDRNLIYSTLKTTLAPLKQNEFINNLNVDWFKILLYLTQLFPKVFNESDCNKLLEFMKKIIENLTKKSEKLTINDDDDVSNILLIIEIFTKISGANSNLIDELCQYILTTEKLLSMETSSLFRNELLKFLLCYPAESINILLQDKHTKDEQWCRFLEFLLNHKDGKPFRDSLEKNTKEIIGMLLVSQEKQLHFLSKEEKYNLQYQGIKLVYILNKFNEQWLLGQYQLVEALKKIWCSDGFQERYNCLDNMNPSYWNGQKLLLKILCNYFHQQQHDLDILFQLLCVTYDRFIIEYNFFFDFLDKIVAQEYTIEWKRLVFYKFIEYYKAKKSQELQAKILQFVIIPCFKVAFDNCQVDELIGTPPLPEKQDNLNNIISSLINDVINSRDSLNIIESFKVNLLKLLCLFVDKASSHIHTSSNNREHSKLKKLMDFLWPCITKKNDIDPITKYHGYLLICHIIGKFDIRESIVARIAHDLLESYKMESVDIVKKSLEILMPVLSVKLKDPNHKSLLNWTIKIIVEDSHILSKFIHILQVVVKYSDIYYPVHDKLMKYLVNAILKIVSTDRSSIVHRVLAIDLAQVVIKWKLQRINNESGIIAMTKEENDDVEIIEIIEPEIKNKKSTPKSDINDLLNFLIKFICEINIPTSSPTNQKIVTDLTNKCQLLLEKVLQSQIVDNIDFKLSWLNEIFHQHSSKNSIQVCNSLDLLHSFLLHMKKEQLLKIFHQVQVGIGVCIVLNTNIDITPKIYKLLFQLMKVFPTEKTGSHFVCKYSELDQLYTTLTKFIFHGLGDYEKNTNINNLYRTIIILHSACCKNPSYIDRMINPFMRVLTKMVEVYINDLNTNEKKKESELIIYSINLVKNRISFLTYEMRTLFIDKVLICLIEKTLDIMLMENIINTVAEWMKNSDSIESNQVPKMEEKKQLILKITESIEERFPTNKQLNKQFLELIVNIYHDDKFASSDLPQQLESAFSIGLKYNEPEIREVFFQIFNNSIEKNIFKRLYHIIDRHNWDTMGSHYWIKQCIEFLILISSSSSTIKLSNNNILLSSINSIINNEKRGDKKNIQLLSLMSIKEEKEDSIIINLNEKNNNEYKNSNEDFEITARKFTTLNELFEKQIAFSNNSKDIKTFQFIKSLVQLCHMDTKLAENIWLDIFPSLWSILDKNQHTLLASKIIPFICSGIHVKQKNCHPSAISTFIEALSNCNPPIPIRPPLMKYVGKSYNLWHIMTLSLEKMASQHEFNLPKTIQQEFDDENNNIHSEIFDSLSDLYSLLNEEDMMIGLWQNHAHYQETKQGLTFEQQGYYDQAQYFYGLAMKKFQNDCMKGPLSFKTQRESIMWEQHWIHCIKELNQWDILLDYSKQPISKNPLLIIENSWKTQDITTMKEIILELEHDCPEEYSRKINIYRGYLSMVLTNNNYLNSVDMYANVASRFLIQEWNKLPHIVSNVHIPLLQDAQKIVELREVKNHHVYLHSKNLSYSDMESTVKAWLNRMPTIADDLSHWSDIFIWRQNHYPFITRHYDDPQADNVKHMILGAHGAAQDLINFSKIARKHNLPDVCHDSLKKIQSLTSVSLSDCSTMFIQELKYYKEMALLIGKNKYQEAIDLIDSANLEKFGRTVSSEIYGLRGMFLSQINNEIDANKSFSVATQLNIESTNSWAFWGNYYQKLFTKNSREISIGMAGLTCLIRACQLCPNEFKTRKYIAKIFWLLTHDDDEGLIFKTFGKYTANVPVKHWLYWIPQLTTWLLRDNNGIIVNLFRLIGRTYPHLVFYSLRTLYLNLKAEQVEEFRNIDNNNKEESKKNDDDLIKATPAMLRCSRILLELRKPHPTVLSSLEGIIDQTIFTENSYEKILFLLRMGLDKCYKTAFENRKTIATTIITTQTVNFMNYLVTTFMNEFQCKSSLADDDNLIENKIPFKKTKTIKSDSVFEKMKKQFIKEFDFRVESRQLFTTIRKLKKWIKIFNDSIEQKFKKSFLIEEKCRFLSNFSLKTAEIYLPGEFLSSKNLKYCIKIAKFKPIVDIVQKNNTSSRRFTILGHDGKYYSYLVVNNVNYHDGKREARVLQLFQMLNDCLTRRKETSRRFLNFTIPRIEKISPKIRLIEENPSSLSLLEIYKRCCEKLKISPDYPIENYYQKLIITHEKGVKLNQKILRDIWNDIEMKIIPASMLKNWAVETYSNATDYWMFRKNFTSQLSLLYFAEYVLYLTNSAPNHIHIYQDSGLVNNSFFRFDFNAATGELNIPRCVPFRLTPNIFEFLTNTGVSGPLIASTIAIAHCIAQPSFEIGAILCAILSDEVAINKVPSQDEIFDKCTNVSSTKLLEKKEIVTIVNQAVTLIISRLNSLVNFDGTNDEIKRIINAATSHENLCRMDPSLLPWF